MRGVGGGCDAAGELAVEPVVEEGVLACASWIDIVAAEIWKSLLIRGDLVDIGFNRCGIC